MTRLALVLAALLLLTVTKGSAVQLPHGAHAAPPPPLPALPVIARVHVDASKERVLVVHEIVMARGDYAGGDLDLWVSFGPTMPRAFDAHLLSMPPNASVPDPADQGEPIPLDKLARRPPHARILLGRSQMVGALLHLREPAVRRAIAATNVLALRVRQVLPPPPSDGDGAREVVVRLGMESSTPLTIRRIDLSSTETGWMTSASAQLCGPNADAYIIGFASAPRGVSQVRGAIDPTAATRRLTDDLCIRYVTP